MKIEVFEGKKSVTVNDDVVNIYNRLLPEIDSQHAEMLLLGDGIDETTSLSNEELSKHVTDAMQEELDVVKDMTVGGKAKEAFDIYNGKK